ncbi:trypsin-like peptidase domain-containing protein [Glaciihabitans sp. UYNi722]|uniref:S1C family serine protease n=1 Tax=Glaciihabitans sp. UYNi722 TaxID=3156344 RepID=UPI0033980832
MTDAPQEPISGSDNPETPAETEARFNTSAPTSADATPTVATTADATPTDAFGQPLTAEQPAPAGQGTDYTWAAAPDTAAPATTKQRSAKVGLIAALAVGALVGGVSGAGVAAWAVSANQPSATSPSSATAQNITVNDTASVNVVTAVAAKAEPSVVTISTSSKSAAGTGSGVILSKDGYVLTNTHVVTLDGQISNPTIQVTTADGHLYSATVVGTDPIADLAVIKLKDATDLTPATFGDSSKLNVGETAIAIGAPLGLSNTVTDGIVSSLNRSISIASSAVPNSSSNQDSTPGQTSPFDFRFDNGGGSSQQPQSASQATISLPVVQTDAAINPGNSGGALLNSNAEVIGINVAIAGTGSSSNASTQSGNIGVGFAIPANLAQRIANELIKDGKASHGLLGASVSDVAATDSSAVVGASLKDVTGNGAAANAGLKSGDVVTNFNGIRITGATDLTAQVRYLAAGSKTDLTYVRGGKSTTVSVTLGALK